MSTRNPLLGTRIEFHILQSFPVSCLNRDDVGSPKTALVGGVPRARVSSQSWKRAVRLAMRDLGVPCGTRTKLIASLVLKACLDRGATPQQAKECGLRVEEAFIKKKAQDEKKGARKKKDTSEEIANLGDGEEIGSDKTDTLLFLNPSEVACLADVFKKEGFDPNKVIPENGKNLAEDIAAIIKESPVDGIDVALFGRMVAQAATMNIEGAASFSHAISTHRVNNEVEFFTALDDLGTEPGSAHMGSLEFNSATYYRYISLDLGQLFKNLGGQDISTAVSGFVKALFVAVPSARQATMSAASPWEFAKVLIRKGQRLQIPFESSVRFKDGGYLGESINFMKTYISKQEKLHGSLFGKKGDFSYGEDENFSIDTLISSLTDFTKREVGGNV